MTDRADLEITTDTQCGQWVATIADRTTHRWTSAVGETRSEAISAAHRALQATESQR